MPPALLNGHRLYHKHRHVLFVFVFAFDVFVIVSDIYDIDDLAGEIYCLLQPSTA